MVSSSRGSTVVRNSAAAKKGDNKKGRSDGTELRGIKGLAAEGDPAELDGLIHQRVRLAIVSALAVNETLSFSDLKALLKITDGNLSVHARKLEDAGYIECSKFFEDRVPRTEYRLAPAGQRALERYLSHMEALIKATRER